MITFVYCCICVLIVCCQTTRIEDEDHDFTNDSPDFLPKVTDLRYKIGSDMEITCNSNRNYILDDITWEFKRCHTNYRGRKCDKVNLYKLDDLNEWRKLDTTKRRKLEIRNVTEDDEGLYRCLFNGSIIKIYQVDIIALFKYRGPSPEVVSLLSSSNTTLILPNTHVMINCKVTSIIRPEIRWFKKCNGRRCDVLKNGHCYCPIPLSNTNTVYDGYPIGNNFYLSKLNINNARTLDSGDYVCFAISLYGQDYKNITIRVKDLHQDEENRKSLCLLFSIPLCFVLVPIIIWLCFNRRNNKKTASEHQKQLIKPVTDVVDVDDVV